MRIRLASLAAIIGLLAFNSAHADIIGFEDFDGGAINLSSTTNVFDFGSGGGALGDVMGVVSSFAGGGVGGPFDVWDDTVTDNSGGGIFAGDTIAVAGQATTAFFAMNDMDGTSAPGFTNSIWSFDISSANSLTGIQMDIGAFGDFEASSSDGFLIEAQIDGGGYSEIFSGVVDESASKTYRAFDDGTTILTLNDPLELFIDGVATGIFLDKSDAISGLFDTYSSTLFAGMSGGTLDLRISWAGTPSGTEPMGFDNFTINGTAVPEPTGLALLGVLAVGMTVRRRRR